MKILGFALALMATQVGAAELTLNDLPATLNTLRGCGTTPAYFGSSFSCKLSEDEVWAAVHGDSRGIIIFYKNHAAGIDVTGHGPTVAAALRELAFKFNAAREDSKRAVDALGPMLPTQ